jgi:glutamine amidotransferase
VSETVAIIDYGSGNLRSAAKAFERAARETGVEADIVVTADAGVVRTADRIVLPGVGAFADCRAGLDAVEGMVEALEERVVKVGMPFFGICVGMQLMAGEGREKTITPGLGWIPGAVVRIEPGGDLKVPHMGWNTLAFRETHPLLAGIPDGEDGLHAYFVHSYHLEPAEPTDLVATASYGEAVTAIVGRDNLFGTQFHPEKSQKLGLTLIANFLRWSP